MQTKLVDLFVFGAAVFFIVVGSGIWAQGLTPQQQADAQFDADLARAKIVTDNSCDSQHFSLVAVEGSSRKSVVVFFGQVIPQAETGDYKVVVEGGEVALQHLESLQSWQNRNDAKSKGKALDSRRVLESRTR